MASASRVLWIPSSQGCLLAIDPGGSIGIAVKDLDTKDIQTCVAKWGEGEIYLYDIIAMSPMAYKQIIIERFATSGRISGYGLHTVELVGGVKALCHVLGIPLSVHTPQKRYAFQDKAKELLKGQQTVIHEEDALAHLLAWEYYANR